MRWESRHKLCNSNRTLRESCSLRSIETALFGVNCWWHIRQETNQNFLVTFTLKTKTGITFLVKFLSRSFLLLCQSWALAHCLIKVSDFSDLLAIDFFWHCIWSWFFVCQNVKTASSFLGFFEWTNQTWKESNILQIASVEFLNKKKGQLLWCV